MNMLNNIRRLNDLDGWIYDTKYSERLQRHELVAILFGHQEIVKSAYRLVDEGLQIAFSRDNQAILEISEFE